MPDVPLDTAHVWAWFQDLNAARSSGMAANPISFTEIDAYCRLHRLVMAPWEVALVRRLDSLALSRSPEKERDQRKPQPQAEKPAATPADVAEVKLRVRSAFGDRRVVKRGSKALFQE